MSNRATTRTFTCAACDEEFESTRTDEAAIAEAQLLWNHMAPVDREDCQIVCEECFLQIMMRHGKQIGRA